MKKIIFALAVLSSPAFAAAGPSISGGTSEAPWVRSHDVLAQVMDALKMEVIESVGFTSPDTVVANVNCNGQNATYVYHVTDGCRPGVVIPGFCIPQRTVELEEGRSHVCR